MSDSVSRVDDGDSVWELERLAFWSMTVGFAPNAEFTQLGMPVEFRKRTWRCRRRLRALFVRPRSRELLDRLGLITGVLYIVKAEA